MTVRLLEILKNKEGLNFETNQEVAFVEDGREVQIAGQKIETWSYSAHSFRKGKRYLVSAVLRTDGTLLISPASAYQMEADHFDSLRRNPFNNMLSGLSPENAIGAIKEKVGRDKRR